MKPPVRWKDAEAADPVLRQLFRAGRRTEPMPAASRLRGARHAAALGLVPILTLGLWSKGVVAAFAVGFGGALGLVSLSPGLRSLLASDVPPSRPPANVAGPRGNAPFVPPQKAVDTAAVAPPRSSVDAPEKSPETASRRATVRQLLRDPQPPPAPDVEAAEVEPSRTGMSAELELLLVARRRLIADAPGALLLLDRHRVLFPAGALGIEREILSIDALARTGQREAAREKASALLANTENRFYADRLRQLLSSF